MSLLKPPVESMLQTPSLRFFSCLCFLLFLETPVFQRSETPGGPTGPHPFSCRHWGVPRASLGLQRGVSPSGELRNSEPLPGRCATSGCASRTVFAEGGIDLGAGAGLLLPQPAVCCGCPQSAGDTAPASPGPADTRQGSGRSRVSRHSLWVVVVGEVGPAGLLQGGSPRTVRRATTLQPLWTFSGGMGNLSLIPPFFGAVP